MRIELPGNPIPWKRARTSGKTFYDAQFQAKQNLVWYVKATYPLLEAFSGPLKVLFTFEMSIPTSWSKKRRGRALKSFHSKRPDLSNLIKFYEDALNEVFWDDDCLIATIEAVKIYSESPRTIIEVIEIEEEHD